MYSVHECNLSIISTVEKLLLIFRCLHMQSHFRWSSNQYQNHHQNNTSISKIQVKLLEHQVFACHPVLKQSASLLHGNLFPLYRLSSTRSNSTPILLFHFSVRSQESPNGTDRLIALQSLVYFSVTFNMSCTVFSVLRTRFPSVLCYSLHFLSPFVFPIESVPLTYNFISGL